jgi:hypothetical protein
MRKARKSEDTIHLLFTVEYGGFGASNKTMDAEEIVT